MYSSVIACCVRPQNCLFTLVWRSHRQSLLPPFLSDEAAYLAAPLRLSYFCFGPKAIKWHQSDGLDCSCLCVKHSETLQEKLLKPLRLTHTRSREAHIRTHAQLCALKKKPIDVNPGVQQLCIRSWLACIACSERWTSRRLSGFFSLLFLFGFLMLLTILATAFKKP